MRFLSAIDTDGPGAAPIRRHRRTSKNFRLRRPTLRNPSLTVGSALPRGLPGPSCTAGYTGSHLPGGDLAAVPREQRAATSRRWAEQLGVVDKDIDGVCDRVLTALDGLQADEKGRWLLDGDGYSELPLTGLWKNSVVSVVIDRVRIDDSGIHWIVDYKSGSHTGGSLDEFLDHEVDRYAEQLEKYAMLYSKTTTAPVRAALYFPLLQSFREVPLTPTVILQSEIRAGRLRPATLGSANSV